MKNKSKISPFFGFSYLDAILLLVVGLILSVGIYIYTEERQKEMNRDFYLLQVELFYEDELISYIPQEKDTLYNGEGEEVGEVISILSSEEGHVILNCKVEGDSLPAGDTFAVETSSSVKYGTILSRKQLLNEMEEAA